MTRISIKQGYLKEIAIKQGYHMEMSFKQGYRRSNCLQYQNNQNRMTDQMWLKTSWLQPQMMTIDQILIAEP